MGARILVIEDNPTNLELMVYLLQAFGHRTLAAEDGEEGLALARREQPDLIICDVQLPRLDGYAVVQALKGDRALRTIPLIAVTAYAMVGDRDRMLASGFDGYIPKPIAAESFVQQVEGFLPPEQRTAARAETAVPVAPEAEAAPPERGPVRGCILVVDDRATNRHLVHSMLAPLGYAVVEAAGVQEALLLARRQRPDLILSDYHLLGESGTDLIRALKAERELSTIPVVVLSSSGKKTRSLAEFQALGAADWIAWPEEPQQLVTALEPYLPGNRENEHGNDPRP